MELLTCAVFAARFVSAKIIFNGVISVIFLLRFSIPAVNFFSYHYVVVRPP
jgi:hypothetical protein